MVQKRLFDAEEVLEVSFKHPKLDEPSNQLVSFSESVFPDDDCHTRVPKTSEGGCEQGSSEGNEKHAGEIFSELPRGAEDFETCFSVAITAEDDVQSETPVHLPLFPEYLSPERPLRTLARYEDIYSILLEHPPRKPVSIGPNHQADVPDWNISGATDRSSASNVVSDSDLTVGDEAETRLMGTCILPMPDIEQTTFDNEVGKGRIDCSCEDIGSMRCVRQHIVEGREKLKKTFGHEKFAELGLDDMGEQVAAKWSAEEEQLFHEVVFNNPVSLRRNFWNNLSAAFPSRTKKEIVSYYFNLFMLRKRAEQNRSELLDIDSDNDEWQGSEGNEISTREEDEDSVAESPLYQENNFYDGHENDLQDYDEDAPDETCVETCVETCEGNDDSECFHVQRHNNHSGSPPPQIQHHYQNGWKDSCDEKVKHDDSCTSSDTGIASQENKEKTENGDHWCGNHNGVSNGYNTQGYVLEPCDAKVWDPGFVSCSKNKIDFLPTCNMIEEVFGDGRRQDMRRV